MITLGASAIQSFATPFHVTLTPQQAFDYEGHWIHVIAHLHEPVKDAFASLFVSRRRRAARTRARTLPCAPPCQ